MICENRAVFGVAAFMGLVVGTIFGVVFAIMSADKNDKNVNAEKLGDTTASPSPSPETLDDPPARGGMMRNTPNKAAMEAWLQCQPSPDQIKKGRREIMNEGGIITSRWITIPANVKSSSDKE